MGRMRRALTTRSTVLGLPIGRRRTDWAKVGRASMVGLSAISALADLADGVRSARESRGSESQRQDDGEDTRAGSGR
jgi:hypothetical protein